IALGDPDQGRAAAVASIAAASRLEDSVTALRQILPNNSDVEEMARLVDGVKPPRMKVVVAARKRENAQALETLASIAEPMKRIDELSTTIQKAQGAEQARDAKVVAEQVKATVLQMHGLQEVTQALGKSRNQIANFTESIARITSTTRLLSMNAAVEAARAGEAGRGFNFVAQSIRKLSE